jgi:hypothetical protein
MLFRALALVAVAVIVLCVAGLLRDNAPMNQGEAT